MQAAVWQQQTWAENWGVAVPPFLEQELCPVWHNVAWVEAYLHTKWPLNPFSHLTTTDMGRKLGRGGASLWEGELGPHLPQCAGAEAYNACQVSF